MNSKPSGGHSNDPICMGSLFFKRSWAWHKFWLIKCLLGVPKKLVWSTFCLEKIGNLPILKFKTGTVPQVISNYFCINRIFPKVTDTYFPRKKWVFHKFHAAHTTLDWSNFNRFFSLFTIFVPSEAIKTIIVVIEAWKCIWTKFIHIL